MDPAPHTAPRVSAPSWILIILIMLLTVALFHTAKSATDVPGNGLITRTTPVHVVEHLEDNQSKRVTVTSTSQALAALGLTLHTDAAAVTIINRHTSEIFYNPTGTAAATNAGIGQDQVYTAYGDATSLGTVQLIVASDTAVVDLIEHVLHQE